MIEEKIQIILPIILRNVGPLLLRGGLGGLSGGGTTNNGDAGDDDFDDDDDDNTSVKEGDDGRKVSISLPTFPPDTDDDDDEDEDASTTAVANNSNNANVGGNDSNSSTTSSSSSSTAENNVNTDTDTDSNSESNTINASSDQPNVSSHHVEIEAIEMIEIQTSDQPTTTVHLTDSTVNQQPTTTTTTTTTSSQPSVDTITTATDNPITLTGFNNENGIPSNSDPNTNLIFKHTDDNEHNQTPFNAQPDDTYLIDIRSGFNDEPIFTPTAFANSPHTPNEADISDKF